MFKELDISDSSTEFSRKTQAKGKNNFGMLRTKTMKALLHWVKYLYCISWDPTIVHLKKVMSIQQLDTTIYIVDTRQKLIDHSNIKSKEDFPGPLESENTCKEWESKFINNLSTLIGVNWFPMSYVVLENDNTDEN